MFCKSKRKFFKQVNDCQVAHKDRGVCYYYISLSDWFILSICAYLDSIITKAVSWKMKLLQCVLSIKCSKQWCQLCCRQCQVWQLQSLSGLTGFQRCTDVCIWCYNIDSTHQISENPAEPKILWYAHEKHIQKTFQNIPIISSCSRTLDLWHKSLASQTRTIRYPHQNIYFAKEWH